MLKLYKKYVVMNALMKIAIDVVGMAIMAIAFVLLLFCAPAQAQEGKIDYDAWRQVTSEFNELAEKIDKADETVTLAKNGHLDLKRIRVAQAEVDEIERKLDRIDRRARRLTAQSGRGFAYDRISRKGCDGEDFCEFVVDVRTGVRENLRIVEEISSTLHKAHLTKLKAGSSQEPAKREVKKSKEPQRRPRRAASQPSLPPSVVAVPATTGQTVRVIQDLQVGCPGRKGLCIRALDAVGEVACFQVAGRPRALQGPGSIRVAVDSDRDSQFDRTMSCVKTAIVQEVYVPDINPGERLRIRFLDRLPGLSVRVGGRLMPLYQPVRSKSVTKSRNARRFRKSASWLPTDPL